MPTVDYVRFWNCECTFISATLVVVVTVEVEGISYSAPMQLCCFKYSTGTPILALQSCLQ